MKKILDAVRLPAAILCGLGLIFTIYIHMNAISYADVSVGDNIPGYLDFGVFPIWAAAIGVAINRQKELQADNPHSKAKFQLFFKTLFGDAPTFVIILAIAAFLYGNYYGWSTRFAYEGLTDIMNGKLVLHDHGRIVKELSESEFLQYKAAEIRSSTATLMLFYGVGTAMLFP